MGVNGGVQPPNQSSSLLPDAMLHGSLNAQRYGAFFPCDYSCKCRQSSLSRHRKNVLFLVADI